jgi:transposase
VTTEEAGLLVSGRAIRAEHYLHLEDQKARHAKAARRAPKPGQRGSRRWRRHRARVRRAEAAHRRRIQQAQHQGAKQVIAFALRHKVGTLLVGDPTGITRPQRRSGAEPAAAAVAPHSPAASLAGQGRAGRDRGAAGG